MSTGLRDRVDVEHDHDARPDGHRLTRTKLLILVGVVVAAMVGSLAYFGYARRAAEAETAPAQTGAGVANLDTLLAGPHLVFRDTSLGSDYGNLAVVSLADPQGPRAATTLACERVYATAGSGVCVNAERGVVQTYSLIMLDRGLRQVGKDPLSGLPSRARMSKDGSLVSTTTFVTGHSYAQASFSTSTIVRRDGKSLGNLESFTTILPNGQQLVAADRNYWGVTFAADDDTFYATAASNGHTWLVKGSLSGKTMKALHDDAECPSLSPDGTKIAYKKRLGNPKPGVWRLAVLDLATGQETLLAETRNVDDQMEWLDDGHVLYGLPREGTEATTSDIWGVPITGSGSPSVVVPGAASPAVVRM